MFDSPKPYHISKDGTIYYLQEESNLYVKKLNLTDIQVFLVINKHGHQHFSVNDHNKSILITSDLGEIGKFLESLADQRHLEKYGF